MKINLKESLNELDMLSDNRYDLYNTYLSKNPSLDTKKKLSEAIYNNKSPKEILMIINEDWDNEESEWTEMDSKSVRDSDGFLTDYTWYRNNKTGQNVFVFGDKDLYGPEDGYFDWECDTDMEGFEWFKNYVGPGDEDDDWMDESLVNNESLDEDTSNDKGLNTYVVEFSVGPLRYDDIDEITVKARNEENALKVAEKKVKKTKSYKMPCNFHIKKTEDYTNESLNESSQKFVIRIKDFPFSEFAKKGGTVSKKALNYDNGYYADLDDLLTLKMRDFLTFEDERDAYNFKNTLTDEFNLDNDDLYVTELFHLGGVILDSLKEDASKETIKWKIAYDKGRPGGEEEVVEFPTYREAKQYAADHAKGWGFEVKKLEESLSKKRSNLKKSLNEWFDNTYYFIVKRYDEDNEDGHLEVVHAESPEAAEDQLNNDGYLEWWDYGSVTGDIISKSDWYEQIEDDDEDLEESLDEKMMRIEPSEKELNQVINVLNKYGFKVDDNYKPGRGLFGSYHIQVINPDLDYIDFDQLVKDVEPVGDALDNLSFDINMPITYNFGANDDNVITGGIDIHVGYKDDSDLGESLNESKKYKDLYFGEINFKLKNESDKQKAEQIMSSVFGDDELEGGKFNFRKTKSGYILKYYGNIGSIYYEKYFKEFIKKMKNLGIQIQYKPESPSKYSKNTYIMSLDDEEKVKDFLSKSLKEDWFDDMVQNGI